MTALHDSFGAFARVVSLFASSPAATALAFALVFIWVVSGAHFQYSGYWQLPMNTISSVITFLMVFVLNNTQSRDTAAINAKLDMLILSLENADNRLIGLEHRPHSEAKARVEEMRGAISEAEAAAENEE